MKRLSSTTITSVQLCCRRLSRNSINFKGIILISMSGFSSSSGGSVSKLSEPIAKKVPAKVYFGKHPERPDEIKGPNPMDPPLERVDDYYWLRDDTRKDEEVIKHLNDENAFCEQEMDRLTTLKEDLYDKMIARLKETDNQVPYKDGAFMYYTRTVKGKSYKIHARIPFRADFVYAPPVDENAAPYEDEEIVLDENEIAKDFRYSDVSDVTNSPDHKLAAYGVDNNGYETYRIRVKEIGGDGKYLDDSIEETTGSIEWSNDNRALFYLKMDSEHRPNTLWMHTIGTPESSDIKLFQEDDPLFWMGISKTFDERFLIVETSGKETSEIHYLDLTALAAGGEPSLACFRKREHGHRYEISHQGSSFYVVTNKDGCKNHKLMVCPDTNCDVWTDVKEYNPSVHIENVMCFKDFLVVHGRESGFGQLWVASAARPAEWTRIEWPEQVYDIGIGQNAEHDSNVIRVGYSSMVTPRQVIDINMATGGKVVLKTTEVPGYDKNNYSCLRMEAPAQDGKMVPMSVVFRKDLVSYPFSKPNPCILYAYGSYGYAIDPSFSMQRTVLLDRGVVYIIAHIRGGGEMGRSWYEDEGKYLTKMNTFNDMGSCADHLIKQGVTTQAQLATLGRSAGGLLMGAMANMYPHLFKCIVASVPFVDVVNTMSDPTIPLTVTEWEEWGNPNEEKYFEYMLSYSPYDNVKEEIEYPAILITAGLNDPRVAYWEPAKWVAKMRACRQAKVAKGATDLPPLLLKTDMTSGHFSASDRYKHFKEEAFEYAFILDQILPK